MKKLSLLVFILLITIPQSALTAQRVLTEPETLFAERIPIRPKDSVTGSQFAFKTAGIEGEERQQAALSELLHGNIPPFLRNLKPVRLSHKSSDGKVISAVIWVMPDYLAIGDDNDFLRIPLTYPLAIRIATEYQCILPTRKMVDEIYKQAACQLKPQPLFPGFNMRSSEYYLDHQRKIEAQRRAMGCTLGDLTSGHKKDVVLTNRLIKEPDKIAIYGWHNGIDDPIQPLSTFHGSRYTDYSHGIRLVYHIAWLDGEPRSIVEVLADPLLAPALTYEGIIDKLRSLLRFK